MSHSLSKRAGLFPPLFACTADYTLRALVRLARGDPTLGGSNTPKLGAHAEKAMIVQCVQSGASRSCSHNALGTRQSVWAAVPYAADTMRPLTKLLNVRVIMQ